MRECNLQQHLPWAKLKSQIDFNAVGRETNLKPPAARMRLTRLRRDIENGNLVGTHGTPFLGAADRIAEARKKRKRPVYEIEAREEDKVDRVRTRSGNWDPGASGEPLLREQEHPSSIRSQGEEEGHRLNATRCLRRAHRPLKSRYAVNRSPEHGVDDELSKEGPDLDIPGFEGSIGLHISGGDGRQERKVSNGSSLEKCGDGTLGLDTEHRYLTNWLQMPKVGYVGGSAGKGVIERRISL